VILPSLHEKNNITPVQHQEICADVEKKSPRTGVLIQYIAEVSHTIPAKNQENVRICKQTVEIRQ
jgi:hypothetical protein